MRLALPVPHIILYRPGNLALADRTCTAGFFPSKQELNKTSGRAGACHPPYTPWQLGTQLISTAQAQTE